MVRRRLLNSTKLLNKLKYPKENNIIWFFLDKKNFCQDQTYNKQHNRWIATCHEDVPKVMKTKFPKTVMVFGVVFNKGNVMPPHIFEFGLRVNTNIYLEVMEQTVLPWITLQLPGSLLQSCHQGAMASHQPNLNLIDYFIWGYLEAHTNRRPHTTKASLMSSIKEYFVSLPLGTWGSKSALDSKAL